MKIGKIKAACKAKKNLILYNIAAPENMITQWISNGFTAWPVEGCELTLGMLETLWEIDGSAMTTMEKESESSFLTKIPRIIDSANAPMIELAEVDGWVILADGENQMVAVPAEEIRTCVGKGRVVYTIERVMKADGKNTTIVCVYDGDGLAGVTGIQEEHTGMVIEEKIREMYRRMFVK